MKLESRFLSILVTLSYYCLVACYPAASSLSDRNLLLQELELRVKLKINKKSRNWSIAGASAAAASGFGALLAIPSGIKAIKACLDRDDLKEDLYDVQRELQRRNLRSLNMPGGIGERADLAGFAALLGGMILGQVIDLPLSGMWGKMVEEALQNSLTDTAANSYTNGVAAVALASSTAGSIVLNPAGGGNSKSRLQPLIPPCKTLFVGNLPKNACERDLMNLFSNRPGFQSLRFIQRKSRPIAFVEFQNIWCAQESMKQLQGIVGLRGILSDRGGIRISYAKNP